MASITVKLLAGVIAFAFIVPVQAETVRKIKHKRVAAVTTQIKYRGTDKFRAGPLYEGLTYLGDDPDPFIRSQIARDVNAAYGGND